MSMPPSDRPNTPPGSDPLQNDNKSDPLSSELEDLFQTAPHIVELSQHLIHLSKSPDMRLFRKQVEDVCSNLSAEQSKALGIVLSPYIMDEAKILGLLDGMIEADLRVKAAKDVKGKAKEI